MRAIPYWRGKSTICMLALSLVLGVFQSVSFAQRGSYPGQGYYAAFGPYADGDYGTAAKAFRDASRSAVRSTEGRWIDSICYHTMIGESLYRMGEHAQALDHFNSALQLFIVHRNWMLRVEFPQVVGPLQRQIRPDVSWGVSKRSPRPGQFPSKLLILQAGAAVGAGRGVLVNQSENYSIDAVEIVRCTALAMYRRMEIMGATCPHDPLTGQLLDVVSRRPAPPNHWSQAWIDALVGISYAAANKPVQAASELSKSLRILGQYDHPLTPIALLTLGRVAMGRQQYNTAINFFYEATFPAAAYGQTELMSDAASAAALAHMVSGQRGVYPPLGPMAAWAHVNSRSLESRMYLVAGANLVHGGATAPGYAMLEKARGTMRRSEMSAGVDGARLNYLMALANFQRGNIQAGSRAFQTSMAFQRKSSLRLFQTGLADRLYTSNRISDRIAIGLYETYLNDPQAADWALDPMETITSVLVPHSVAMEHWFEVALKRREHEKALEISDLIRRRRFYSSLPMGGRLLSLRWVLEAPEAALTEKAVLQRRDILTRYPAYAALSRRAAEVRTAIAAHPLIANEDAGKQELAALRASLVDTSSKQELVLQAMALQRDAADFVFPPPLNAKALQNRLTERQVVLSFYSTNRSVYAFLMSKQKYAHWRIGSPTKVKAELKSLLKSIGLHDKNQAVQIKDLNDSEWKQPARELMRMLIPDAEGPAWEPFDELVVVPDGVLWYLPFELLQIADGAGESALSSKVRIRYSPTVSLSEPDRRRLPPSARTAIVVGKMTPRDDDVFVEEAAADLLSATGGVRLPDRLNVPSALLAKQMDQLVVFADIEDSDRSPYAWSPAQLDRGKLGSTLGDWLALPWGGPQQLALPGYHTSAENSLRRGGTGAEVFLSICGMMASGSRTILLSRWRVGGASSQKLVREYVQELPYQSASLAWRRSLDLSIDSPLDPTAEPRVQGASAGESPPADHPFFWSGYMLVDTGVDPSKAIAPPAAGPALEIKRAGGKPGEVKPGEAKPGEAKPGVGIPGVGIPAGGIPEAEKSDGVKPR
jgi:tetratricopeptide (TPR) repeat protein